MKITSILRHAVDKFHHPKKIILIDGDDLRSQEAAHLLSLTNKIIPVLLFEKPHNLIPTAGIEYVNVFEDVNRIEKYIEQYAQIRKGKETIDDARKFMQSRVNIAMMMLYNKEVDGVVGGLTYPTADILRGAFKIIGTKTNVKTISSVMLMHKQNQSLIFTDISVVPKPNVQQLVDIGFNAVNFFESMNFEQSPKVSYLSFSTNGSAKSDDVTVVKTAALEFSKALETKKMNYVKVAGEIQFDAAVDPEIRQNKYKSLVYENSANIFVFPNLDAGNIGYKIAQRLGDWGSIGPILVGLNAPVNDLSRGATKDDVFYTCLITALLNQQH